MTASGTIEPLSENKRLKICLACSHGGHLTEMLQLHEAFEGHDTFYFCYDADTTRELPNVYLVPNMARNPIEFLKNLFRVRRIFKKEKPDLVVSTGAEIAIPVVLIAKLHGVATVYVECGAQATTPSVTGRVMYWLADEFYVQWRELVNAYGPRAMFRGSLIDEDAPFAGDLSVEKRLKVSLVQPAQVKGFSSAQPPMGLGYIASVLQQKGCEVRLLDANAEGLSVEDTVNVIKCQKPDLVGLTVTTPLSPSALEMARRLRKIEKPPILVAGGPHATVLPEELFQDGLFDYVVRGEGEITMGELTERLLGGLAVDDVQGLSWQKDGEIVHNPDRQLHPNIEEFPYPDWSLFPLKRYSSLARRNDFCLPITTSRGCPFACTFCYKGVFGRKLRMRSPQDVVDEWQFLIERYGAKEIAVLDDTFSAKIDRAIEICDLLVERGLDNTPWSTTNGIRVDNVTPELFRSMKKAGCYRVYFGIESGVQRVIDLLNKKITIEQVKNAVKLAKQAGLEVGGYFMLGNVGETLKDIDDTIEFALELGLDIVQFTIATPYPGTVMFEQIKKDGELLIDSWEDLASYGTLVFKLDELTPESVAGKYKKALRSFYFRPKFMISQLRQMLTWTGFRHRVAAAWILFKMSVLPSK